MKIDGGVGLDFLFFNDINTFGILNGGVGFNSKDNVHLFLNPQIGLMIYELYNMKSLVYYEPYFIKTNHIYDKYVLQHNIFTDENHTFIFNFERVRRKKDF
ncbi:MAG: hypothetical protein Q9M40_01845 [Sulfurimonas sp.]|nr:hypothetical protein [Sulfurimonas sp.]